MFKVYKRIECIVIIVVMVLSITTDFSLKQTNAASVYYIYTVEDLYDVRNHLDGTFYLMNDLDISKETSNGGLYDDEGRGWKPIGDNSKAFCGVFYGQGHTIKYNIKVNSSSFGYAGLFGKIGTSTIIQDLKVEGSISGTANNGIYIGGIAGYAILGRQSRSHLTEGLVKNCFSNVKIDVSFNSSSSFDDICVGGIIGYMADSYWYSSSSQYTFNTIGKVDECVNAGEIKVVNNSSNSLAGINVGGVVGYIDTIKDSSNTFSVAQSYNEGSISLEDKISGDSCVSGICGNCSTTVNVGINNCYNTGYISNKCNGTCSSISKGGKCSYCYNVGGRYSSTKYWSIGDNNENNNCYSLQGFEVGNTSPGTTYLNEQQMTMKSMILFNYNVWLIDLTCVYKYPQLKNNRQYNNKEITLVELIQRPDKLKYYKGDDINLDNGVVKVYYVDGSTQTMDMTYDMLNKNNVDSYTSSLGNKSVYIYPDLDENPSMNTRYEINVINKPTATNLQLLSLPSKTEFVRNTSFDFSGCKVQVAYDNGDIEVKDITLEMTTGGDISKIGNQTIKYTLDSLTVEFSVKVIPLSTSRIEIEKLPAKRSYLEGAQFDASGMVVRAYLNDGTDKIITDYQCSGYSSEPGTHTITVESSGCTATFEVTVVAKTPISITVSNYPNKTTYVMGEEVDPSGMVVKAAFDNGTYENVEGYTIDSLEKTTGLQTVAVRYNGLTTYIPITVIAKQATDMYISSPPNKTRYIENTEFDSTGLEVFATYNDGVTEKIDDYQIVGANTSSVGTKTVTVMYQGFTDTFEIDVVPKTIESIRVLEKGKDNYFIDENLDTSGLKIEASFDNGSTEIVDGYQVSGFTGKLGENIVTVEYQGKRTSYIVKVHEPDDEWTITKEPTCLKKGEKVKYCKDCKEIVLKEDIDKLGHTIVFDTGKAATCTENGLTNGSHCSVCSEVIEEQRVIPALGHTPSDSWEIVNDSNCLDSGSQIRKCTVCNEIVEFNTIEAKGHKLVCDEGVFPTCTKSGLTEGLHCEECGEIIIAQSVIEPLGHVEPEDWEITKEATCSTSGERIKKCTVCDNVIKKESIDPTGHTFKKYVSNNDATCTEDGTKTAKCEHCNETKTVIDVNSAKGHSIVYDNLVLATCTESGLTQGMHCSECGEILKKQEVVTPKGHVAETKWTVVSEPTCTEKGLEVCKCVECDEIVDTRKVEAKGHIEVIDKAVDATCTESGLTQGSHCSECGEILKKQEVVAPKGHVAGTKWTVVSEPTCTEKGVEVCKCVECDEIVDTRKVEAKGHIEVIDKAVDATCTESGLTQGSHCSECEEILKKQETIPALGHQFELKHVVNATFFEEGYTGDKICTRCGEISNKGVTVSKKEVPKPKVKFKGRKKKITVSITANSIITKYELTVKIKSKWKKIVTSKNSYTFKKLAKNKKYVVRVRSIVVDSNKKAYSNYVKKTVKTK